MKSNYDINSIIAEGIKEALQEYTSGTINEGYKELDKISRDALDIDQVNMSDEERAVFDLEDELASNGEDDISDIVAKYASKSDEYEGGYQDDVSITPGYFNEVDDLDSIAMTKTSAKSNHDFERDAIEYAGEEVWRRMSDSEKEEVIADLERGFDRSFRNEGKAIQITTNQLQGIIREGVQKLHKKTMIENRLQQINDELNKLNDQDAWDDAKNKAQSELEKKNINWTQITERPNGVISEKEIKKPKHSPKPNTENNPSADDKDYWAKTKSMPWQKKKKPKPNTEKNPIDEEKYSDNAQDFISSKIKKLKDEGKPQDQAVAIAMDIARDKGYKVPDEPKNETYPKEKVKEIMSRANDLMAEAKRKMNYKKR